MEEGTFLNTSHLIVTTIPTIDLVPAHIQGAQCPSKSSPATMGPLSQGHFPGNRYKDDGKRSSKFREGIMDTQADPGIKRTLSCMPQPGHPLNAGEDPVTPGVLMMRHVCWSHVILHSAIICRACNVKVQ